MFYLTHKIPYPPLARMLGILLLAACNQAAPPSAEPPADAPTALVYGAADSPVLTALGEHVRFVEHTGSEQPEDHDLVVLDGHTHGPDRLQQDAFVAAAVRSGTWVLAVDVDHEHKRDGLGHLLNFATHGSSPGYFVRKQVDENGQPRVTVLEHPTAGEVSAAGAAATTPASSFVDAVVSELGSDGPRPQATAPAFPRGLRYASYAVREPVDYTSPTAAKKAGATQPVHYEVTYTVYVILENRDNPLGDRQYVAVEIEGQANPTSGTDVFANMTNDEKAWFQGLFELKLAPAAANDQLFSPVASGPDDTSGASSVTSNADFTVGYRGLDGPADYAYTNPQTRPLADWAVSDEGSGNAAAWRYGSKTPLDWDRPDSGSAFAASGYPLDPNDFALGTLRLHAQAVWRTNDLNLGAAEFAYTQRHGLAEVYCAEDAGATCAEAAPVVRSVNSNYGSFSVNLAAVVPTSIASLSFAPNPAPAGRAVTGTLTLSGPAQVDTAIPLSSNSPNATVLPTVTVARGETSADFQVLTSGNGLAPGGRTVATVTARYANDAQAQLTVEAPPPTVVGGLDYTCAVGVSSRPVCWGAKREGERDPGAQALPPGNLAGVLEVSASTFYSCAVTTEGSAVCWGQAGFPAVPATLSDVVQVSAGYLHACALRADGGLACWGRNANGAATPPSGSSFVQVSAGPSSYGNTCAVSKGGTVACWGFAGYGQNSVPAGLTNAVRVGLGGQFACALKGDGTVTCWGSGAPPTPGGLSNVSGLSVGGGHACALGREGTVTCWGRNDRGQTDVPGAVQGAAVGLGLGDAHSCAVLRNGTVTCWGRDDEGQTSVPAGLNLLEP